MRLYSWKDYKCFICKELFAGNDLYIIPSEWNYSARMCHDCYSVKAVK